MVKYEIHNLFYRFSTRSDFLNFDKFYIEIFSIRKDYRDGTVSPKSILHTHTMNNKLPRPIYHTEEKKPERVFKSVLELNGVFYTTTHWDANKGFAEQSSAIVALEELGVDYKSIKDWIACKSKK
jgi:hypothetical protein